MPGPAFPGEMSSILDQASLCCKSPHMLPVSVSVHYADAPVPRKVILALSFLSRVSSELAWAKPSYCK